MTTISPAAAEAHKVLPTAFAESGEQNNLKNERKLPVFFFEALYADTNPDLGRILDATWDSPSSCWSSSDPFAS
jgi:hypothetical protein